MAKHWQNIAGYEIVEGEQAARILVDENGKVVVAATYKGSVTPENELATLGQSGTGGNIDGGDAYSVYGGSVEIDCGGAS